MQVAGSWELIWAAVLAGGVFSALTFYIFWMRRRHERELKTLAAAEQSCAEALSNLQTDKKILADKLASVEEAYRNSEILLSNANARAHHFELVLNAIPTPIWRRSVDLKLAWCNRTYATMVEESAETVVARDIELAANIDRARPKRLAEAANNSGKAESERRYIVVDGNRRAYRFTEIPQIDGSFLGFAEDISTLDETESELARHTSAHADVLQRLNTPIAIFGPDKKLILFNHAFASLWRLEDHWLDERPGLSEILETLRERRRLPEQANWRAYKEAQLALFTSIIDPREEFLHLPDERTLRVVISPHPFGGLLFYYEDVTDRLGLERARNTLIAVQRATIDNLFEGVAVFGGDGRLKLWNPGYAKIWNLSTPFLESSPHVTETITAIRPSMDDGRTWEQLKVARLEVFTLRKAESVQMERPDGSVIDCASVPLPDGAMLYTYLDITDSTRIERALRERNEALYAADQLKSEFIANVSYGLRTPLTTIIGFSEIIANQYFGPLTDRQSEYVQGIRDSSHHLLLLVNDILDLATIESGYMQLELEEFDLHALLSGIVQLAAEQAKRRQVSLQFDCPPDIGLIEADERRIKQIAYNLINNALKFTPSNGSVTVMARHVGEDAVIEVTDTGSGIPEEEQVQVFEKFVKGRNAQRQPGAGLGLPLVRSFVEMHGGHVQLKSIASQGTTVTCTIPWRRREPA